MSVKVQLIRVSVGQDDVTLAAVIQLLMVRDDDRVGHQFREIRVIAKTLWTGRVQREHTVGRAGHRRRRLNPCCRRRTDVETLVVVVVSVRVMHVVGEGVDMRESHRALRAEHDGWNVRGLSILENHTKTTTIFNYVC